MPAIQERSRTKELAQKKIRRERSKIELARIQYQRALVSESETLTQKEIASAAMISQPSVSEALEKARTIGGLKEGFSGGTLHEIFLRYSADEITKTQLIDELSRWEYEKPNVADSIDGLLVDLPNTFREVEDALIMGIIEDDVYSEVLNRLRQMG
ncbi:MAG: hypothetical protein FWD65_05170 [Coriobacteriia bacterium]|nr:hypothetical protein [Coriobacteriia bacterium]